MYSPNSDILEISGDTFGMTLIKVEGKYWYGHKLRAEGFCGCRSKFGPYDSLGEAVKNLSIYLKTYGGSVMLRPASFDNQGNPQNPDTEKFHKGDDW